MSIELREKPISNGRLSLYLQIYTKGQKLKKEFLGLYILAKPKTSLQRNENTKISALAELKLSERKIELAKNGGVIHSKASMTLAVYCQDIGIGKKAEKTKSAWKELVDHLNKAKIGDIKVSSLTVQDCQAFRTYLTRGPLAQSSQSKYFGLFRTAIRDAHMANFIPIGLHDRVNSIPRGNATKEFLRQEELDRLFSTPVRSALTRKAFLFSCLTGMRHSDIKTLKWSNVHDLPDGGCQLRYTMQKTGKGHILPIKDPKKPSQARELMGKRGRANDLVFPDTPSIASVNYTIHRWRKRAEIAKPITFHSARHTFATLALSNGVPLKVVSDWLGHSSVVQTEVYARLLEDERDRYVGAVSVGVPIY
jgi:integrase